MLVQFGPQYHLQDGYKVLIRTKKVYINYLVIKKIFYSQINIL